MTEKTVVVRSDNIGFLGLLTLIFIAAKLFGAINWSWFWVLSPILLPIAFAALIFVVVWAVAVASQRR